MVKNRLNYYIFEKLKMFLKSNGFFDSLKSFDLTNFKISWKVAENFLKYFDIKLMLLNLLKPSG